MQDSCITDWELYQKVMAKKKTITVCMGVGMDQIFPQYITIEIPHKKIDTEIKTTKKNG